jgi:hypothetical protein
VWKRAALLGVVACGRVHFDALTDALTDADPLAPLLRYPMDDDPSTGLIHATRADYDLTCTACPTAIVGHIAGGYMFDGTLSLELPAMSSGLVGTNVLYTFTAWAQPQVGVGTKIGIVSKPMSPTSAADAVKLFVDGPTPPDFAFETFETGVGFEFLYGPKVTTGWHHVAISWDRTTKRIYVDGVLGASAGSVPDDSAQPLVLAGDIDNGVLSAFYTGGLDDVRFYDRVLDDNEIAMLAAQ